MFYHTYNEEVMLLRAMGKAQKNQPSKIAHDDDGHSSSSSHSSPTDEDFQNKSPLEHLIASPPLSVVQYFGFLHDVSYKLLVLSLHDIHCSLDFLLISISLQTSTGGQRDRRAASPKALQAHSLSVFEGGYRKKTHLREIT